MRTMTADRGIAPGTVIIETPEQVRIHYRLASPLSRLGAYIIDMLIAYAAVFIFVLLLIALNVIAPFSRWADTELVTSTSVFFYLILNFLMQWGYFAFMEGLMNGKTFGKNLTGIRVISRSGRELDVRAVILRNFVRFFDQDATFYLGAFFSILFNREFRRIGDLVADTVVVYEERAGLKTPDFNVSAAPRAIEQKVLLRKLDENDLYVLRSFLNAAGGLPPEKRVSYAARLANTLQKKLADSDDTRDPMEYLHKLYESHKEE